MNEKKVSLRYARAIYDLAEEQKNAQEIFNDFVLISNTIKASKEFKVFLDNPVINPEKKKGIIEEIFKDKISNLTLQLLLIITEKGRDVLIQSIAKQYEIIFNEGSNRLPVKVITANELNDTQKLNIVEKLSDWFKMVIIPEYSIDKSVIGGIKFLVNDKVIDSTVKNQLEKIKNTMVFGN